MIYGYEKGDCIILGSFRYVVLEVDDDKVLVTNITKPSKSRGKWVLKSLLPTPIAKINIK